MISLLAAAASTVLSTADFCDAPIEGGVGEPQFCVLSGPQEITTPYFSVEVMPGVLVGVYDSGRRFRSQASIRQSQIGVDIEYLHLDNRAALPDRVGRFCTKEVPTTDGRVACDGSSDGIVERMVVIIRGRHAVIVEISATPLASEMLPVFEAMVESVAIKGS